MNPLRPYPARLQRGTLLMVHSLEVSERFVRMERTIHIESLVMLAGGTLAMSGGWLVTAMPFIYLGFGLLLWGGVSWLVRLHLLEQRRRSTPGMIFISQEGIEAILPDNSGMQLQWGGIEATHITLQRRIELLPGKSRKRFLNERAIVLKSVAGTMLCLTEDLSGYGELLDILADLGIPVVSASSRLLGIRGGYSDWHHRLEYRARQSRN